MFPPGLLQHGVDYVMLICVEIICGGTCYGSGKLEFLFPTRSRMQKISLYPFVLPLKKDFWH